MAIRIVSGGQTGVDRAALDVAIELGLGHGGWCPRGRRAEDGPLDARYALIETPSSEYEQRTSWNVRDSDATLILHRGPLSGGTAFTREVARRLGRPLCQLDLETESSATAVRQWLSGGAIAVLNVAGPRETGAPGIYRQARLALLRILGPGPDAT